MGYGVGIFLVASHTNHRSLIKAHLGGEVPHCWAQNAFHQFNAKTPATHTEKFLPAVTSAMVVHGGAASHLALRQVMWKCGHLISLKSLGVSIMCHGQGQVGLPFHLRSRLHMTHGADMAPGHDDS